MWQDNPWLRWLLIALAVLAVVLLIAWFAGAFDSEDGDAADTTTTTVADTTTTVADTTTTVADTTTTTLALPQLVLADDGIGGVSFGATPEDTIAYAEAVLGPPDDDSGWVDGLTSPYGVCPEPLVRGVAWGANPSEAAFAFTLLFTNSTTTHGSGEHFFGYYYFGGDPALATVEGITYGSTNQELQTAIPSAVIQEDPFFPAEGAWMSDVNPSDQNLLWGGSTSVDPTGVLQSVNGGSTCGE